MKYFIGIAILLVAITLIIGRDFGLFGKAAAKPYDMTALAGAQVCADNAEAFGRVVASVEVRVGIRPHADESEIRETDTFVCVFTSGETLPFMATYVGGKIVDVR